LPYPITFIVCLPKENSFHCHLYGLS